MSYTISIGGHKDFPADTHTKDTERLEALVIAEIDALLPQLISRLDGHGMTHVTFHGQVGTKYLYTKHAAKPQAPHPS